MRYVKWIATGLVLLAVCLGAWLGHISRQSDAARQQAYEAFRDKNSEESLATFEDISLPGE